MTQKEMLRQKRMEAKLREKEIKRKEAKNQFKTGNVRLSSSYDTNQKKLNKSMETYREVHDLNSRKKITA